MRRKQEEVERLRLEEEDRIAALELQVTLTVTNISVLKILSNT